MAGRALRPHSSRNEIGVSRRRIPTQVGPLARCLSYEMFLLASCEQQEAINRTMGAEPPKKKPNYRQEAENIRAKAHATHDADARSQLLVIATLYDKLADHLLIIALQPKSSDDPPPEHPPE
jgi:hypothetical protein